MKRSADAVLGGDTAIIVRQLRWRWAAGALLLATVGTWLQGFLISRDDRGVWWDTIPAISALPLLLLLLALVDRRWWVRTLGLYVLWGQLVWMFFIALLSNGLSSLVWLASWGCMVVCVWRKWQGPESPSPDHVPET